MASAEQPSKKQKLCDPPPPPNAPPSPPPPPPPAAAAEPQPPLPQTDTNTPTKTLSQEEILRKQRNQEEIRNFCDSYKRIKYCVSQKDARFMAELEQSYLALITASRGCMSVQRLVAEVIPKYASYCPTALEAAAKVCINMHNWSVAVINRGEDADGVAFQTAKACIFGLADICRAASSETPTSSVIQGICSAVFLNVLSFFISSFEGQGIFQIVNKDVTMILDSPKTFSEFKLKFSDEDESASVKLSKFRALSILWVFFSCPKNSLAACFELYSSSSTDAASNGGQYFLTQVTSSLDAFDVAYPLYGDGLKLTSSVKNSSEFNEVTGDGQVPKDNSLLEDSACGSKSCLLGLALNKDPSLRSWIFSRYKNICKSASPNVLSDISSTLERVFKSFREQVEADDKEADTDADSSSPSKFIHRQFSVPKISDQHRTSSEVSTRDGSYHGNAVDQLSCLKLEHHGPITSVENDVRSNTSSNIDSVGANSNFESPLDSRSQSFDGKVEVNHSMNIEKNHASTADDNIHSFNTSSGGANSNFESPKHNFSSAYPSTSQPSLQFDGDSTAMDICLASRQLWLGSLGPEASEPLVRFQFEKFGPIDKFSYLPFKGFAVIEYKSIVDALKAMEVMRGSSPWGACLVVKFLDLGVGSRGYINGVAIGTSCDIYVGNVSSQGEKDEIMYELSKVLYNGPVMVNDLIGEGGLLMEFGTPEEAATAIAHLRQHRKEKHDFGPLNFGMPVARGRHASAPLHHDLRNNNFGNAVISSPLAQRMSGFSPNGKHHTNMVNQGAIMQNGHGYQPNWTNFGANGDNYDTSMSMDPYQAGGQNWKYRRPESQPYSAQGHNMGPPQPPFIRPMYYPPNGPWDGRNLNYHTPINTNPSRLMPNNLRNNGIAPPFLPASVTPLAQLQRNSMAQHDQMFYAPPHLPAGPPPQPELPPPLPPSPPLLHESQPPPPPPVDSSMAGQWRTY